MTRLVFLPAARTDLHEASKWYDQQRNGLGKTFLLSAGATLASIQENPHLYPKSFRNARRALLRRFPYGIYDLDEPDEVVILAVWHTSREPDGWQVRI